MLFIPIQSGTALDLPFLYLPDGRLKEKTLVSHATSALQDAASNILRGGVVNAGMSFLKGISSIGNIDKAKQISTSTRTSAADVISISGCKDRQTSADTHVHGLFVFAPLEQ